MRFHFYINLDVSNFGFAIIQGLLCYSLCLYCKQWRLEIHAMYPEKENFKYSLSQVYFSSAMTTYHQKYGYGNYRFKEIPSRNFTKLCFRRHLLLL